MSTGLTVGLLLAVWVFGPAAGLAALGAWFAWRERRREARRVDGLGRKRVGL